MTLREYAKGSREIAVGIFFVIPCLALYEIGIVMLGSRVRNGADVLLRRCFELFGPRGLMIFNFLLLAAFVGAAIVLVRRNRPVFALYPAIVLEAALYALLLSRTVLLFKSIFFPYLGTVPGETSLWLSLVLSVGAGVYEELFFRLFLLGGLVLVFERYGKVRRWVAITASLLIASTLFSAFHHIGPFRDPFTMDAFVFRVIAGMILGAIFLWRGLAVVVYTHAFYDILVFLREAMKH